MAPRKSKAMKVPKSKPYRPPKPMPKPKRIPKPKAYKPLKAPKVPKKNVVKPPSSQKGPTGRKITTWFKVILKDGSTRNYSRSSGGIFGSKEKFTYSGGKAPRKKKF